MNGGVRGLTELALVECGTRAQDLPGALGAAEIAAALDLSSVEKTRHQIVPCTARTLQGKQHDAALWKGVKWLIQQIESDYSKLSLRVEQEAAKQVRCAWLGSPRLLSFI